jgi:hypothetical protein
MMFSFGQLYDQSLQPQRWTNLAYSFFYGAFGLLDRSLDAILFHRIVLHSFGAMPSPMSGGR